MKGRRVLTLIVIVCLGITSSARANPWTRDQATFYLNLSYSFIGAQRLYAPNFKKHDLPDLDKDGRSEPYTQHTLSLYGEVGIVDRWLTAVADVTLLRKSRLELQGSTFGLGDMRLGFWSGLLRWPVRVSLGVTLGLPTGDPAPDAGAIGGADQRAQSKAQLVARSLPTGDGEFDLELAVAVGYSFGGPGSGWPLQHYIVAQVAYWLRTKPRSVELAMDLPDAFNWKAEFGMKLPWTFINRFWFIGRVFGSEAFASQDDIGMSASGLGTTVHTSFAVELYGRIWRGLGASFAVAGAFRAAGLPAGLNYRAGLNYEY
jgi:hypothetical protein